VVTEHLGRLFKPFLETYVSKQNIASLVLADTVGTANFLRHMSCDPGFLLGYGIPMIAVDHWSWSESGKTWDVFATKHKEVPLDWLPCHIPALVPVPFVRPQGIPGACQYLPARPPSGLRDTKVREQMGIPARDRVVLLCTAHWQHADYTGFDVDGARMTERVPELVAHHFCQLGPRVHLIHVGLTSWDLAPLLGERYHWMPPLPPHEFDRLLASVDLLLSLNVTSTVIGRAIVCQVPIVALYNSCSGDSLEEICLQCSFTPTPFAKQWVQQSMPLYPFWAWPLGLWKFLSPVLLENSYMRTMETVEVLDEIGFVETCNALLTNSDRREKLLHEQVRYVAEVSSLPRPGELLTHFLGAG
jgi:hypothetical protein